MLQILDPWAASQIYCQLLNLCHVTQGTAQDHPWAFFRYFSAKTFILCYNIRSLPMHQALWINTSLFTDQHQGVYFQIDVFCFFFLGFWGFVWVFFGFVLGCLFDWFFYRPISKRHQ